MKKQKTLNQDLEFKIFNFFNKENFNNFFKNNLYLFSLLLFIYTIISIFYSSFKIQILLRSFFIIFFFFIIAWYLLKKFSKLKLSFVNFFISGLIIFLIVQPSTNWYEIMGISFLLAFLKLFRYKHMQIINPVVLAILVYYILSKFVTFIDFPFISWWGASYGALVSFYFILPVVLFALYKFKKFPYFSSYLISYFLFGFIFGLLSLENLKIESVLSGTLLFAIGIMAIEIKTSPFKFKEQIFFGILGGFILSMALKYHFELPYIMSIFLINLIYFFWRFYNLKLKILWTRKV